ncbi:MAG TPA: aminotransferase class V-fold PLP-dependent enzyme [Gemmataceae bacterium]|nr:aminotransferase class V-fold PLP-dependent enzyme [Gemmataceae bacterium]
MNRLLTTRRSFLATLTGWPYLGGVLSANRANGAVAAPVAQGRDVIQELGVRSFINAAGTFTALSGSLMPPEVMAAMQIASRKFVRLDELHDAVGKRIAELLHCEAALVTAGCASALSLATAACVAGSDPARIRRLPDTTGMKNEVIIQKTHRVGYDHAVRNAGVRLIEVETREELEKAITERTAMMFFLNAANPRGKIHYEEFIALGKKYKVPTLNDAAADVPPVENLWKYTKMGFDLVAFSGGKGLRGPQSAGLLLGRKDLIEAAKLNNNPHADSLCRTNKVNKEEIVGMLVALELFLARDHAAVWADWEGRCRRIAQALKDFDDVRTEMYIPEIANAVPHLRVRWDYQRRRLTPAQMARRLREGKPSIEVNPGTGKELILSVWMMEPGEDAIVAERVREILART